jgi:SP family general alpha glucoside:H+ symporter-like MFS transporter
MWPLPLAVGIFLAPESPWWLVRKGRGEDAKKALLRLTSLDRDIDFDADETVAMIAHTTSLEEQITAGSSYLDCFKGVDCECGPTTAEYLGANEAKSTSNRDRMYGMGDPELKRQFFHWIFDLCKSQARRSKLAITPIRMFARADSCNLQFLEQAGLDSSNAINFTLGKQGINMVGVFGAWFLMSLGIGRRTLFLYGLCGLFTMLLILGFLGIPDDRDAASLATGAIMLVWAAFYQVTVGTIAFSLVAELSTRRLQIKTVALGRALYNVVAIICNVLTPYMLTPTAWNFGNYAGFFWAGSCFLAIVYTYFRVPEPAGRTFAELDLLFERRVSARKFKETNVDAFEETVEGGAIQEYEEKIREIDNVQKA